MVGDRAASRAHRAALKAPRPRTPTREEPDDSEGLNVKAARGRPLLAHSKLTLAAVKTRRTSPASDTRTKDQGLFGSEADEGGFRARFAYGKLTMEAWGPTDQTEALAEHFKARLADVLVAEETTPPTEDLVDEELVAEVALAHADGNPVDIAQIVEEATGVTTMAEGYERISKAVARELRRIGAGAVAIEGGIRLAVGKEFHDAPCGNDADGQIRYRKQTFYTFKEVLPADGR